MKKQKKEILSGEDCFVCGSEFIIHTYADQACPQKDGTMEDCDPNAHHAWHAFDGDAVTCPGCGATAWVSCDGESAYIAYDEMSKHNGKCYEKYDQEHGTNRAGRKL